MGATGLSEGKYSLGALGVIVSESTARTESGFLTGLLLPLDIAVRNHALWTGSNLRAFAAAIDNPISSYALDTQLAAIDVEFFDLGSGPGSLLCAKRRVSPPLCFTLKPLAP